MVQSAVILHLKQAGDDVSKTTKKDKGPFGIPPAILI
jgi:hypothetical protein